MSDNITDKNIDFDAIRLSLAGPEQILSWSHGEVTKPETINYRTQKPEKEGLFCERIFGPTKDWECYCGKYKKIRYKGIICDKCGVQVTRSLVRRERMGHIALAAPVAHIWYLRSVPSRIGLFLGLSVRDLEKVIYFAGFIIKSVDEDKKSATLKKVKEEFEEVVKEIDKELESKKKSNEKAVEKLLKENKEMTKKEADAKVQDEFKQWKKEMEAKKEEMKLAYDEAKEDLSSVSKYAVISEGKFMDLRRKYGEFFKAGIGAEVVLELVKEIDVNDLVVELEKEKDKSQGQKRKKILKRLRFAKGFIKAKLDPSWMILTHIAVIPPDIRPMVQLDGGRFATSDTNDLYRRVINRNNRLKKLQELHAPEIIQRNEKRMLQEAVDALIGNDSQKGRGAATGAGKKKLKSLSEGLKGKQGRFRQNLLGKRVDYSGRSVIVVGPDLSLDECGVPKIIALELFKPFIISELIARGFTHSAKNASKLIDSGTPEVWDILEEVTKKYMVLLNRAPTLHRLGIQAFKVVLIEGKAVRIHPLVCSPFNADFDGDQMAIHLPLSSQAQEEARELMISSKNLLKLSDGSPSVAPSNEIVLGCYYITSFETGAKGEGKAFSNTEEAVIAYQSGKIHTRAKIKVKIGDEIIETSVGRILFNEIVPEEFGFINEDVGKKNIGKLMDRSFKELGLERTAGFADSVKRLGFFYSTRSGLTLSMGDLVIPETKYGHIEEAERKVDEMDTQYKRGLITANEKYLKNIGIWTETKEKVQKDMMSGFDEKNPLYLMFSSKARGSEDQVAQIIAIRGLLQGPSGNIIDLPIKSNFKEGLTVLEYFISSHGARKGLTDVALKTSDAGYLTRRMVDVSQDIIIAEQDCDTDEGLEVLRDEDEDVKTNFMRRLDTRIVLENIVDKKGNILFNKGEELNPEKILKIVADESIKSIKVRSVLGCKSAFGVCQTCYGRDLGRGRLVKLGEAVGIVAAQSIGEPGTQLTMRTFHSGGIAKRDITQGLPRVEELFEARTPKAKAVIAEIAGKVELTELKDGLVNVRIISNDPKKDIIKMKPGYKLLVKDGDKVEAGKPIIEVSKNKNMKAHGKGTLQFDKENNCVVFVYNQKEEKNYAVDPELEILVDDGAVVELGQKLTEGHIDPYQLLLVAGALAVKRYIVREIQEIYESQGQSINDKHIEIIIRQMFSRVRIVDPGDSEFIEGEVISKTTAAEFNLTAKNPIVFEELLLGITKSALNTDSFLSAASFQETTAVLIDAATSGKMDHLKGLKENVILGKLIPAGTGFKNFKE